MSVMEFTKIAIKNLFSKSVTTTYPKEKKENYDITRGHIEINIEDCILCGLCSRKCPTDAIEVNREEKSWKVNRLKCIQCGNCIENCPKKCLKMKNEYTKPTEKEEIENFYKK